MKKNTITYAQALEMAIKICSAPANIEECAETVVKLSALKEKYEKPREGSDEAREKAYAKRKEATAKARAELLEKVTPILRANLSEPVTAKELYELCKAELPEDFTWNKVQHILIHEMKPELEITERKRGGNTYQIAK